ncbi:transglutaminase domain-containing protein [Catenulispora sp. NF23]|uniref:Transglutaminase domain-containing protein n=1 Tax=Catenulispora pinistramenti TaxID=2705254 RepID=A0ABS5KWS3_9ACTN|nr:transglutaminase-like domain-containing protein [Catenulispora pinistramenti]MBS2535607.1 transglutaminase domain-containing protein [Catenulispora pinistramenti]MBS2550522.1 transglutaminase domain-containing protein [Catenulispora pinistramenti]
MPAHLDPTVAAYYSSQSAFSDPGPEAAEYADLPDDPAQLAAIARNLLIHRLEGGLFNHTIATDRLHNDAETRYVDSILHLLLERDASPLPRPRDVGDRFVGVCRDFVLLHCSFLRHAGIPARMRCGFADYFDPQQHGDHVVTEYWDPRHGWRLADPQLADPKIAAAHTIDFDPMNIPRDRFHVAGAAWQAIRTGTTDPQTFGHWHPEDPMAGEWFVAQSVRLDFASLNKTEMLLWDIWGTGIDDYREVTEPQRDLYDRAAQITSDAVAFDEVRVLYAQDDRLHVPAEVWSLAPFNGPQRTALRP